MKQQDIIKEKLYVHEYWADDEHNFRKKITVLTANTWEKYNPDIGDFIPIKVDQDYNEWMEEQK